MNRHPRKTISVAGVRLTYLDIEPSAPSTKSPLLLLHGLLATAETLSELIGHLPSDRRIVALDILSTESDRLSADAKGRGLDLSAAALANVVGRFAHSIHLECPILIGHSHGGALALRLATAPRLEAMPSEDIQGLVLLCPAHPFEGYRSHVVSFYLTRWGRFLALCIPLAPNFMILRAYNDAAGPTDPITMAHLKPYLPVLRNRDKLRRVLQMLHTWEVDMSDLRTAMVASPITHPTLLIWGDHDTVVPPSTAATLQQHLRAGELAVLHGVGHLLAEEAPEQCGALIRAWLIRLETGTPGRLGSATQLSDSRSNSSESQERSAAFMTSSFEFGD